MPVADPPSTRLPIIGAGCEHLAVLGGEPARPTCEVCEECGARRILRICLDCGHVGCCDSHRGHATAHARESGHLLIRAWKGGAFVYCYQHGYL